MVDRWALPVSASPDGWKLRAATEALCAIGLCRDAFAGLARELQSVEGVCSVATSVDISSGEGSGNGLELCLDMVLDGGSAYTVGLEAMGVVEGWSTYAAVRLIETSGESVTVAEFGEDVSTSLGEFRQRLAEQAAGAIRRVARDFGIQRASGVADALALADQAGAQG